MARRRRWFLLAAFFALACFAEKNSFLGPNGLPQTGADGCHDPARIEDRENTVGVLLMRRSKELCTGTLISPHVVLTAAHCVAGENIDNVLFSLSGDPTVSGTHFARVQRLLVHPEFSKMHGPSEQHVDLALVQLESSDYGPAPKGYYSVGGADEEILGQTAQVIGFGTDKYGIVGFRRTKMVTLERNDRRRTMLRVGDGPNGQRPCPGDSGAPVLKFTRGRMRVIGVFSWSAEKVVGEAMIGGVGTAGGTPSYLCRAAVGEFATWIDAYRDWVETNRKTLETDTTFRTCP